MEVFGQAAPTAFGVEIILIPVGRFLRCRGGLIGVGDILDVVAVAGDQRRHPFWPQGGDDACSAPSPVVSAEGRLLDVERIHQAPKIIAERRLLA